MDRFLRWMDVGGLEADRGQYPARHEVLGTNAYRRCQICSPAHMIGRALNCTLEALLKHQILSFTGRAAFNTWWS
jgi:hypothetical protein